MSKVDDKNTGLRETNLLSLSYGQVIRRSIDGADGLRPASYETYNIIQANDIVLRMTDLQNDQRSIRTGLAGERGIITAAYVSLRPHTARVDPRYLAAALRAYDIEKVFYDMGAGVRQTLGFAELGDIPIPLPHLPTQRAIADYLDRETGEIDAMLGKLDALAGVLATRRGEVVRGALATIERKPYLGLLVNVVSGSGFPHEFQGVTDSELPFFKVSSFAEARQGVMGSSENTVSRDTAARLGATVIPKDSILMAKIGAALLLGRYARTDRPCCIDNNMQALTPRHNTFEARFLAYAMSEVPLNLLVKPGPVPSLDVMGMKMTRVPQPPLSEQRRIADHLDEVTGRIDAMLAKVAQLKAVLTERRAALITDVVTGRKEVA